jgi:hypothetical protein
MHQIIYALQFKGQAAPSSDTSSVLKATTSAPSSTIATTVGPEGVNGSIQPAAGGTAQFASEVSLTTETSFQEAGTIPFGDAGHRLRFSTVGEGYIAPSADSTLMHGCVSWRIDEGEGQFQGATGLITSNFTVSEAGEVIDNQFGVIFVP